MKELDRWIQEISRDTGWTKKSIRAAIQEYGCDVTCKEDLTLAMLCFARQELKSKGYTIGVLKRSNNKKKQIIEDLIIQLERVQEFYEKSLEIARATIREQGNYINELLQKHKDVGR